MEIYRAEHMGMCSGVRCAIALVDGVKQPSEWTILGDLVHNNFVMRRLMRAGFRRTPADSLPGDISTKGVIVTAHGCSSGIISALKKKGKKILDTTCPKVGTLQNNVRQALEQGMYPVILGDPAHVEIRGITDDLEYCSVYSSVRDIENAPQAGHGKIAVFTQTTFSHEEAAKCRCAIRIKNPDSSIEFFDTLCDATRERQTAAARLCGLCDGVVVIGGKNSNNTKSLAEICSSKGVPTLHVQGPEDVPFDFIEGMNSIGLTAGASTPDELIEAVAGRLQNAHREHVLRLDIA